MGCCCSGTESPTRPRRLVCPGCGGERPLVERKTLLNQLTQPWRESLPEQGYGFCDGRDCEVVYFGEDGIQLRTEGLRGEVGQKRREGDAPLCYCFGIRYAEAEADPTLRAFVIEQTDSGQCSCDSRNPSGRCCLKDFPKG